jgi:hypothetical protein
MTREEQMAYLEGRETSDDPRVQFLVERWRASFNAMSATRQRVAQLKEEGMRTQAEAMKFEALANAYADDVWGLLVAAEEERNAQALEAAHDAAAQEALEAAEAPESASAPQ